MESKRSSMQASQHGKGQGQAASKTQIVKTASEVSLSPSQAAEQAKVNARKNPLDALSRSSIRHQMVEKRSGLQEVDDEYFKSNIFSRQGFAKHSGLNDGFDTKSQTISNLNPAGQSTLNSTESTFKLKTAVEGGAGEQMPSQAQVQQTQSQAQVQLQSQAQMQCKNQTFKENNAMPPPTSTVPSNEPQPDMCTTCPNCQTTIYLVRAPESGHENPAAPHHGQQHANHENPTPAN